MKKLLKMFVFLKLMPYFVSFKVCIDVGFITSPIGGVPYMFGSGSLRN